MSPNPAHDNIFIQTNQEWISQNLRILDITSKVVFERMINQNEALQINVSEWPKGVYLLQTNQNNQRFIVD